MKNSFLQISKRFFGQRFHGFFDCQICKSEFENCDHCIGGIAEADVDDLDECCVLWARGEVSEEFYEAAKEFFEAESAAKI